MAVRLLCLVEFFNVQVTEDDVKVFFQRLCGKVCHISSETCLYFT
jgi:hypothetical protein